MAGKLFEDLDEIFLALMTYREDGDRLLIVNFEQCYIPTATKRYHQLS